MEHDIDESKMHVRRPAEGKKKFVDPQILQTIHDHGTTWIPRLFALPMIILVTASKGKCLMCSSEALIFAISYTCFRLTVPVTS